MSRLEKLELMLSEDPADPFLHYAVAKELISSGRSDEGLQKLAEVNETFPDYVAAYFQRAQTLAENGRTEDARQVITRGIAVAENVGDAHAEGEMRGFLEML